MGYRLFVDPFITELVDAPLNLLLLLLQSEEFACVTHAVVRVESLFSGIASAVNASSPGRSW